MKYKAFLLVGLDHWLWFSTDDVKIDSGQKITGTGGWGKNGALTNATFSINEVRAKVESDSLPYF